MLLGPLQVSSFECLLLDLLQRDTVEVSLNLKNVIVGIVHKCFPVLEEVLCEDRLSFLGFQNGRREKGVSGTSVSAEHLLRGVDIWQLDVADRTLTSFELPVEASV